MLSHLLPHVLRLLRRRPAVHPWLQPRVRLRRPRPRLAQAGLAVLAPRLIYRNLHPVRAGLHHVLRVLVLPHLAALALVQLGRHLTAPLPVAAATAAPTRRLAAQIRDAVAVLRRRLQLVHDGRQRALPVAHLVRIGRFRQVGGAGGGQPVLHPAQTVRVQVQRFHFHRGFVLGGADVKHARQFLVFVPGGVLRSGFRFGVAALAGRGVGGALQRGHARLAGAARGGVLRGGAVTLGTRDSRKDVLGAAGDVGGRVLGTVMGRAGLEGRLHQVGTELAAHGYVAVLGGGSVEFTHHAGTGGGGHVERRRLGGFDADGDRLG
jgi:hypothetical protein